MEPAQPLTEELVAFQFAVGDQFKCKRFHKTWEVIMPYYNANNTPRYELREVSRGVSNLTTKSETLLSDVSLYTLCGGPSYTGKPRVVAPHRYVAGDKLKSTRNGAGAIVTILSVVDKETYRVKSTHRLSDYDRERDALDDANLFTLVGGPSFGKPRMQLPDIDLESPFKTEFLCEVVRKSICDCGGHKLGYRDDELHGHGTWCKLVELSQGVKRAN